MTDKVEGVSAHERPVMRLDDGPPVDLGRNAGESCYPSGLWFDAFGEPRTRYVRVSLHGNDCIMHPSEGDTYVQECKDSGDSDWDKYITCNVWLSEREFEDLPEHTGF